MERQCRFVARDKISKPGILSDPFSQNYKSMEAYQRFVAGWGKDILVFLGEGEISLVTAKVSHIISFCDHHYFHAIITIPVSIMSGLSHSTTEG